MADEVSVKERFTIREDGTYDYFVNTVSGIVRAVKEIIDDDRKKCRAQNDNTKYEYYFRGETQDFNKNDPEADDTALSSYLDREDKNWRSEERDFYHNAFRLNPECFVTDRTMVERLTRMQHYRLPTRFADLSSNALLATYFACEDAYNKATCLLKDGNLRIFKIHPKKMKHFSSDVITAIAHLPLVTDAQFDIGDETNLKKNYSGLGYLSYEINKERPSFSLEGDLAERLRRDIQQVWAFKPIWNNDRIRYQEGIFLAFGCGNNKSSLNASFSADDFVKSELFDKDYSGQPAPSCGIMDIAHIAIQDRAKKPILDELRNFGIMKELVYPDLADACITLADRAAAQSNRNKTKEELSRIVESIANLTGQVVTVEGSEADGYFLSMDKESKKKEPEVVEEAKSKDPTDAELYDDFWIGFKKYMRTHHPQAPESFVDAKEYHDRRNWFNTYIGAKIDEGWFDLNYTYTKEKTISIYICTQNLATRDALTRFRDQIDAVMAGAMPGMKSNWEHQNFKNNPNGIKRIVFSLDCSKESDEVVYGKMVKWMVALADVLNRLTTTIKYRKKEDFDINTLK